MQRRKEPRGSTTASRLKSLFLCIQSRHGRSAADAFLLVTKLDREYLDDETRLVSLEVWHRALVTFSSRFGREEIAATVPFVVHRDNLGVFTRVIRGAQNPRIAFQQLDQAADDNFPGTWKTLSVGARYWRGRLTAPAAWEIESDGLCAAARQAELSAIPILFGLPPGDVQLLEHSPAGQVYEVRWANPGLAPVLVGASGGTLAGVGGTLVPALAPFVLDSLHAVGLALSGTAIGFATGLFVARERRRRRQNLCQLTRIQVLERAATLREARERGQGAGFSANTVIAGQYRLGVQLGVGASGAIWEAERLSDGEKVAVKLLKTAVAHDGVAADRLRREAAALGLTWHPNVVEIYDEGHLPDGTSYLVMERLKGESLATRLRRVARLTPEELAPVVVQVCDALEAVHAAGVVHRDLKPSNIFIVRGKNQVGDRPSRPPMSGSYGPEHVKLLDFGVAQVEWAETRLTNTGIPLGTMGYMSPEQEQGLESDARSDLFALGQVIKECLTGTPPPLKNKPFAVAPDLSDAESGVQRTVSSLPPTWRELVKKLTAPLPHHRFPDARSVREAVLELVGDPGPASQISG